MSDDTGETGRTPDRTLNRWWLGSTKPKKVIHQDGCPHAKHPYKWANDYSLGVVDDLAEHLVRSGSHRWHHCCQRCNGVLDDAIKARLRRREVLYANGSTAACFSCSRPIVYDFGGWFHADGFPMSPHRATVLAGSTSAPSGGHTEGAS